MIARIDGYQGRPEFVALHPDPRTQARVLWVPVRGDRGREGMAITSSPMPRTSGQRCRTDDADRAHRDRSRAAVWMLISVRGRRRSMACFHCSL